MSSIVDENWPLGESEGSKGTCYIYNRMSRGVVMRQQRAGILSGKVYLFGGRVEIILPDRVR